MTETNPGNVPSASRRYYVGITSVLFAALFSAGSAQAGGWEQFIRRCLVPMEVGEQPVVLGLDLIDGDPVGQAFDLPGQSQITIRPPFQELGTQCLVMTKPVAAARAAFEEWLASVIEVGRYTPDPEIESRWLTSDDFLEGLALDVWQEGGQMVFQLSFLETQS
ncbi:MAG: hypothetical protein AAF280_14745 [Pseudomonadota bacterium]